MKNSEKNRDPERARKRAASDARCALRKLDLMDSIADWHTRNADADDEDLTELHDKAQQLLTDLAEALGF